MGYFKAITIAFSKSNGAFDISIGPVVKLWRKAQLKQLPVILLFVKPK
jgi:thiamine biosynthesis lipoprotein ApbE